jgi:hypothetical protein
MGAPEQTKVISKKKQLLSISHSGEKRAGGFQRY